jgi:hypothetical protein
MTKSPFRFFGGTIKSALTHAFTQYDERQSKGTRYNPYALGLYLKRIEDVLADIERGAPVREAIIAAFSGSLLSHALKAVGEQKATKDELSGFGKSICYQPVTEEPEGCTAL